MNRRTIGIGIAVALLLIALAALWKRKGGEEGPGRSTESAAPGARPSSRLDVATVARGSIAGAVRDPAGAGVMGATVCGMAYSEDLPEDEQREPRCTETGDGGSYRLDALLPAAYQIQAQAESFIPALYVDEGKSDWGLELAAGEAKEGVDLVLRSGGVEISGVVNDIGGGTVAGAWLFARAGFGWGDRGGLSTARSAADGTFRMWTAPGQVHVSAQADGYAEGIKSAVAPGQTIEILLTPESVLAGRVVEVNGGAPVPGALVTVGGWGSFGDGEGTSRETALTDGDGKFRLTRLAPARYKPTATAAGRYGQSAESVLLGLGETVEEIVIEMHAVSMVKGRVVLADGKTPCPRGRVVLEDPSSKQRVHHGADHDGVVEVDAVLPGTYEVTVHCSGQLAADEYPELVVVDGKDPPEQVWTVGAGGRMRGVVLAHDGTPVAGAQVSLEPVASGGWADWQRVSTESDGTFEADGLRGGRYNVSASADGAASAEEPVVVEVPEGGEATAEIRLVRGGSVVGAVVDESGKPVAQVMVHARGGKRVSLEGNDSSQTLDDGTFQLEGLRPGAYRIIASRERWWGGALRAPGKGDDDEKGAKVEVRAGGVARVRLVVESQTEVISGRVVNADGQPVTDAFVDAERESDSATAAQGTARRTMRWGWSRTPTLTDTDGTFTIEKLSPGTYTVRAYRKGGGEALAENVPVGQVVTLTIEQTGSISGTASTTDGVVPDVMTIAVSDAKTGFRRRERFFRSGGAFTMRDLPAGSLGVSVSATEGSGSTTVPLANGQVVTGLAITIGAGAGVTGRLVTADDGKPLAGYMVQVMPTGKPQGEMMLGLGDGSMPPTSGADGTFEIKNAPSGRVQLMAFPTNMETRYAFVRKIVTLESGRSTDLGDVKVPKLRAKPGDEAGDFGFELKQPDASTDIDKMVLTVALVRADGPAAKAGIKVGDVIVSVDGQDVREDPYQYWMISHVPPGTTVTFGLERGASVKVTAGPPRD